ncbi:hypothetical protein K2X05_09985, partial [bacterium]|nr:hypothetical protein [bacterium]
MKFIIFFLSLFFCFQALSDLTEGNPAVIEYLKKQKAEAEASGEVTTPKNSSSPTSGSSYGPPRTVIENEMCTSELKIFAARPSKSAPSLMTCQMQLDTRFAEHLKEYIPFCAKKAALKDDM